MPHAGQPYSPPQPRRLSRLQERVGPQRMSAFRVEAELPRRCCSRRRSSTDLLTGPDGLLSSGDCLALCASFAISACLSASWSLAVFALAVVPACARRDL